MTDLDELKALAKKELSKTIAYQRQWDAKTILALIERVEKAERENDNLRDFIRGAAGNMIKAIEPNPNSGAKDD